MSTKLDRSIVGDRIVNFTHDSYLYTYGLIQSVALGAAAFILIDLFQQTNAFWPRLSFWLASLLALIVTSSTTARGIIFTGEQYNLFDTILPIILGLLEFLLFTVLQPQAGFPDLWLYWYPVFGLFAICAGALTHNRLSMAKKEVVDPPLEDLKVCYIQWLEQDQREAMRVGAVYFLGGVLVLWFMPIHGRTILAHAAIGLMTALFMFKVVWKTEGQRREIADYMRQP